jgi:hypothetical protein
MQLLDKHPAIRAGNRTTSVYGSLLGKSQRASDDVVRDVTVELCFLRGPCRAYMGSRGDC